MAMNKKDKKQFRRDAEAQYKSFMPNLYKAWSSKGYTSNELRLEFLKWLLSYVMEKATESCSKKVKAKKLKKATREKSKIKDWLLEGTQIHTNESEQKESKEESWMEV